MPTPIVDDVDMQIDVAKFLQLVGVCPSSGNNSPWVSMLLSGYSISEVEPSNMKNS